VRPSSPNQPLLEGFHAFLGTSGFPKILQKTGKVQLIYLITDRGDRDSWTRTFIFFTWSSVDSKSSWSWVQVALLDSEESGCIDRDQGIRWITP